MKVTITSAVITQYLMCDKHEDSKIVETDEKSAVCEDCGSKMTNIGWSETVENDCS